MNVTTMNKLLWRVLAFAFLAAAISVCAFAQDDDKGGSTFEVYGFAMLDTGYQTKQNDPNWFDVLRPTKLPSFEDEYGVDGHWFAGVRQSRLGVKSSTDTPLGELKTQFEFELFGTGVDAGQTTFRLRHAYGDAMTAEQRDATVRAVYVHFCTLLIELIHLSRRLHPRTWKRYAELVGGDKILGAMLSDRPVLVTGPTGSGKELVVQFIHALGPTCDARLMDINCGAIPEQLMESQIFGHEKGAFTGADRRHEGLFSAVGVGTLFLDEIAEMSLPLQAKLLRVLESRRFRPLGASADCEFRGRIVAATHADL